MLRRVIIDVERGRRMVVYPQGGMDLECYIEGPGWVLDNDAEVPDAVLLPHLAEAIKALDHVRAQLDASFAAMSRRPECTELTEPRKVCRCDSCVSARQTTEALIASDEA